MKFCAFPIVAFVLTLAAAAAAGPRAETIGGDLYRSGSGTSDEIAASRDVFAAGPSVTLRGAAGGDAHAAGFDVDVDIDAENVYAIGASVSISSDVAEDLTAAGGSVKISGRVGGNARLAAGSLTVDGGIDGALVAAGGEVIINGSIGGDARIIAGSLSFGPDARVAGRLTYASREEIAIPVSVAPPERIVFETLDWGGGLKRAAGMWRMERMNPLPAVISLIGGFMIVLAFTTVVAGLLLAFAPQQLEARRRDALSRPGMTLLLGVLALSLAFGLIPVTVMTLVGMLFAPFVALAAVALWALGYVIGLYVVAHRVWSAFVGDPVSTGARLLAVVLAAALIALLNFIPFIGWLCNFGLVLFGVGTIAAGALERLYQAKGVGPGGPAVASDEP